MNVNWWASGIDGSVQPGDRPSGDYWVAIPDRPSALHTWTGEGWYVDPKLEHNAPIDAQILAIEAAMPFTHRALREGLYGIALVVDLITQRIQALNAQLQQIQAAVRTIPGQEGFTLEQLPALPDLKLSKGMQNIKSADDPIKALRSQRW